MKWKTRERSVRNTFDWSMLCSEVTTGCKTSVCENTIACKYIDATTSTTLPLQDPFDIQTGLSSYESTLRITTRSPPSLRHQPRKCKSVSQALINRPTPPPGALRRILLPSSTLSENLLIKEIRGPFADKVFVLQFLIIVINSGFLFSGTRFRGYF